MLLKPRDVRHAHSRAHCLPSSILPLNEINEIITIFQKELSNGVKIIVYCYWLFAWWFYDKAFCLHCRVGLRSLILIHCFHDDWIFTFWLLCPSVAGLRSISNFSRRFTNWAVFQLYTSSAYCNTSEKWNIFITNPLDTSLMMYYQIFTFSNNKCNQS